MDATMLGISGERVTSALRYVLMLLKHDKMLIA